MTRHYTNIAPEYGVSSPTVKEYFRILEDTLIGRFLPSFRKKPKRRVIQAPTFYYFDLAIATYLLKRGDIHPGSKDFGSAFEHFMYQEMYAHSRYSDLNYSVSYWRTASQLKIDFVLGDHEVGVEVKATENAHPRHVKGLKQVAACLFGSLGQNRQVQNSVELMCDRTINRQTE